MARSWRDYRTLSGCDKSDNRDKSPPAEPIVPNAHTVTDLPDDLQAGLKRLSSMAAPRLRSPDVWTEIVADAQRIAREGWAQQALGLGWSALDLFGGVTDANGDPMADGLAVRLCGRPLLALCSSFATVGSRPGSRSYLYRGNNVGALLLWELGGGR